MEIQFGNERANQIYTHILSHTTEEAKDTVSEIFSIACLNGQDQNTLTEAEAKRISQAFSRYDQGLLGSLGIESYDAKEAQAVLTEYQRWDESFKYIFNNNSAQENLAVFDAFIRDFPNSELLSEIYFRIGDFYLTHLSDQGKAIEAFENVYASFPSSSQAAEALNELARLYQRSGNEAQAAIAAGEWFQQEPYTPKNFYGPASSYAEEYNDMLFRLAENRRLQGDLRGAGHFYEEILRNRDGLNRGHSLVEAQGALDHIEGYSTAASHQFLKNTLYRQLKQAEYFHYEPQDLTEAGRRYRSLLDFAAANGISNYTSSAEMGLRDIGLRQLRDSTEVLAAITELNTQERIIPFLRDYGLYPDEETDITYRGIPAITFLQSLMLNSCEDVSEVRLAMINRHERVDKETKTPAQYYMLLLKRNDQWQIIDNDGVLPETELSLPQGSYESLEQYISEVTGSQAHSIQFSASFFASTLEEFNSWVRIDHYEMIISLEQKQLSVDAQKMVSSLKTEFNGDNDKREWLIGFARSFSILPQNHFQGLTKINFNQPLGEKIAGNYSPSSRSINLQTRGHGTAVHELVHHWDMTVTRGRDGWSQSDTDPSLIFYRISWHSPKDLNQDPKCPAYYESERIYCRKWEKRPEAEPQDFAQPYGRKNILEDMTTSAESYVAGRHDLSRQKVRQAMRDGNFEPVAKYLFNKYIRSFDQNDGLCFEYDINPKNPPLTLTEVKNALRSQLHKEPNSIPETTLTAVREIEREYLDQRSALLTKPSS